MNHRILPFLFSLVLLGQITANADVYLQTIQLPGNECFGSVAALASGNVLAAGVDYTSNDILLMKLSSTGAILKTQRISGPAAEEAQVVAATSDGGAAVGGSTNSFGAGITDGFLLKIGPSGAITWKRTLGTSGNEHIVRIVQTSDKGLIVLADADHDPNLNDIVVAKFSSAGRFLWRKVFSAGTFDHPSDLQLTPDNGVIVVFGADFPSGVRSVVAKLDATGTVQWSRIYGSGGSHVATSVMPIPAGGYYFTELFTPTGSPLSRTVLSQLDPNGFPIWSRIYQSPGVTLHASINPGEGGNLLLAGNTTAANGSHSSGILIGLNESGTVLWRKKAKPDQRSVFLGKPQVVSSDGSILVAGCAGERASNDMDALILKTKANGAISGCTKLTTFPLSNARFNLTSSEFVLDEIPVPFLTGTPGFQIRTISATPSSVCSAE